MMQKHNIYAIALLIAGLVLGSIYGAKFGLPFNGLRSHAAGVNGQGDRVAICRDQRGLPAGWQYCMGYGYCLIVNGVIDHCQEGMPGAGGDRPQGS